MAEESQVRKGLLALVLVRLVVYYAVVGTLVFGAAGTFHYPGGWVLMGYFVLFSGTVLMFFIVKDPDFIRRRMNFREREKPQKWIIALSLPVFLALFLLPPLHWRLGPPARPWLWIWIGVLGTLVGTAIVVFAFLQNRWASRTIEVNVGQKVIDTGLYSFVRHPMYLGVLFLYPGLSLLLGSPWGLVTIPLLVATLVARILKEEEFLLRELPGYSDYRKKTRWRIVPFVW